MAALMAMRQSCFSCQILLMLGQLARAGLSRSRVSGNGGMNTDYAAVANPTCGTGPFPAPNGVFCDGEAGINLIQLIVSAAYAHDFGNWSVGVGTDFGNSSL